METHMTNVIAFVPNSTSCDRELIATGSIPCVAAQRVIGGESSRASEWRSSCLNVNDHHIEGVETLPKEYDRTKYKKGCLVGNIIEKTWLVNRINTHMQDKL